MEESFDETSTGAYKNWPVGYRSSLSPGAYLVARVETRPTRAGIGSDGPPSVSLGDDASHTVRTTELFSAGTDRQYPDSCPAAESARNSVTETRPTASKSFRW